MKPFPHIPIPSESYTYFTQWLQGNPLDDGISQFFNKLFDIGEVIEVVSIEPLDVYGVRTVLRCRNRKLQKITESLVDIRFGDNPYIDTDRPMPKIPLENRFSLTINMLENWEYEWEASDENCSYQIGRTIGVTTLAKLLHASHNPAHWLYESSIRWMAEEYEKDPSLHMGNSAITMANFVQKCLFFEIRERFGRHAGAEATILDASTVRACLWVPHHLDFDSYFLGTPMEVSPCLSFVYSSFCKEIRPYLHFSFLPIYAEQDDTSVKKEELHAFAKKRMKGVKGFDIIESSPAWDEDAFAEAKPYNLGLSSEKGKTEFLEYLYRLTGDMAAAFNKN